MDVPQTIKIVQESGFWADVSLGVGILVGLIIIASALKKLASTFKRKKDHD